MLNELFSLLRFIADACGSRVQKRKITPWPMHECVILIAEHAGASEHA